MIRSGADDQLYYLSTAEKDDQHEHFVITLVDELLSSALHASASDIHLEPTETILRVRFRINGTLYDHNTIAIDWMHAVVSRLKVLAQLDIAQQRIPQDGKLQLAIRMQDTKMRLFDLRVATFPSIHGEKIVIRILDRAHSETPLASLGFSSAITESINSFLSRASGFFLVTGPTGSGKTTTLYAMLGQLNSAERNIMTMEDPVEYHLAGITQSQVNVKAGFSFENGLRAMLRQDPDVIMIGEIRDKETVHMALQASLTGHVVMSTLHTNSAIGAIARLLDMGIEPYLINASLTMVLAQRLVRILCGACKVVSHVDSARYQQLSHNPDIQLFRAEGCHHCNDTGYSGRVAVGELLNLTDAFRALISSGASIDLLLAQARADGFVTITEYLQQYLADGMISLDEFMRFD